MEHGAIIEDSKGQLVQLPGESRFPEGVTSVQVRVQGQDRILSPADHVWDGFFLGREGVSEDFMNERAETLSSPHSKNQPEEQPCQKN